MYLAVILIVVTVEQMDLGLLNFVYRLHMYPQIFRRPCFYAWQQCESMTLSPAAVTSRESGRNVLLLIVSSHRTEFVCFSQTPQEVSSENMEKKH